MLFILELNNDLLIFSSSMEYFHIRHSHNSSLMILLSGLQDWICVPCSPVMKTEVGSLEQ